jgi:hypothetical protein
MAGESRKCEVCGADIDHRHWSTKTCSPLCASERDQRYRERNKERIAEQMRLYREKQRRELLEQRRRRYKD